MLLFNLLMVLKRISKVKRISMHAKGPLMGVDVFTGKVVNMYEKGVIEPLSVKEQAIKSASEASSMILRIDDVISGGKTKAPPGRPGGCRLADTEECLQNIEPQIRERIVPKFEGSSSYGYNRAYHKKQKDRTKGKLQLKQLLRTTPKPQKRS